MIKSAKKAMYSQINNSDITDEELMTTITGAEAMLNSRPLTYQSANSKETISPSSDSQLGAAGKLPQSRQRSGAVARSRSS